MMEKHNGVFVKVAEELGFSSWAISRRLRKIGKYDYVRTLFPHLNINNLR